MSIFRNIFSFSFRIFFQKVPTVSHSCLISECLFFLLYSSLSSFPMIFKDHVLLHILLCILIARSFSNDFLSLARRMIKYIFTLACVWASTLGAPDVSSLSQAYAPPNLTPSPLPLAPSSPKPMKNMDDLPICFPKTHFVTLTSTQVVPSLVYNTRTLLVPTTISQVRTSAETRRFPGFSNFPPICRRGDEIYCYFLAPAVNRR